jgi:hypothetical protein
LILHIFKMSYQLRNIEQCYLPWPNVICLGKWQITCTATKSDHFMSILPSALFLHSSPHNRVIKCLDFLTFIDKLPYIYFTVDKALCMAVCYLFIYILYSPFFSQQNRYGSQAKMS